MNNYEASDKENQEKILEEYVKSQEGTSDIVNSSVSTIGPPITEVPNAKIPQEREKSYPLGNQIGWIPIPVRDLPTQGLFYPEGTAIAIRSATGAEIRHWSTLNDDPNTNPNFLYDMDDMVNYIIERCVTIKAPNNENGVYLSWKDIKEIDRFYLLLAIHELTFPEGENKLQVKVDENKSIDVRKEMVSYITIDPKLMRHYDEVDRCFVFKKGEKFIKVDIPSIGVTQWIKSYILRKQQNQESFDMDYLNYAPFLIRNWRGLNDTVFNKYVEESYKWDINTISLLASIRKIFSDTINPVIKYVDEGGTEHIAPLNFQGGIKSIFLISDPFSQLE